LLGHLLCDRIVSPADQIRSLSNRGTQRSGVPESIPTGFSADTAHHEWNTGITGSEQKIAEEDPDS
jgi:hypothetical protein